MFESDNQQINQDSSTQGEYIEQDQQQDQSMYYMPEKFLKPELKVKNSNTVLKILIVLLIIGVLAVGAFAVYILKFRDNNGDNNQNVLDLEKDKNIENQQEQINNLDTASKRDEKRIKDINSIISALSIYFFENNSYPSSLSVLSGKLAEIPVNPTPGGENYNYQVNSDKKDYKLTFSLEATSRNGSLILQAGKYQVKSNGIIELYKEDQVVDDTDGDTSEDTNNQDDTGGNSGLLPIPPKGPDADSDNLTNSEEFLFGTEIDKSDTDGDGYLDGDEVANLYDPINKDGKLADNINIVKVFYNESQRYSVLYPAKWMAENKTADYRESVFYDDKNGDFFKIQVYENPQALTLKSWYLSFSPGVKPDDLINFKAKTIDGISTKDGLNIYFAAGEKIYALSYFITSETELNYYTTFLMFTRSFRPMQ